MAPSLMANHQRIIASGAISVIRLCATCVLYYIAMFITLLKVQLELVTIYLLCDDVEEYRNELGAE